MAFRTQSIVTGDSVTSISDHILFMILIRQVMAIWSVMGAVAAENMARPWPMVVVADEGGLRISHTRVLGKERGEHIFIMLRCGGIDWAG